MPKLCGMWQKVTEKGIKYSPGKPVEIGGQSYWLDLYPVVSENPKSPDFEVYLKPAETKGYSSEPAF